jgi:hypothetical protein
MFQCFALFVLMASRLEAKNYLGFRDLQHKPRDVPLALGAGWYSFQFRESGTTANAHFVFELSGPAMFKVADYFCAGDRFLVYDGHQQLGPTQYVPYDNCATNTTSPDWAFAHPTHFSTAQFRLDAGWHRIAIKVVEAFYGGGSAALRLDPIYVQCALKSADTVGLTLVQSPVRHDQAEAACDALGLTLADVDLVNTLAAATDLAFQCLGAFQKVWIRSFDGETKNAGTGDQCMVLRTLVAAPGGQIGLADDCERPLPALCMAKRDD